MKSRYYQTDLEEAFIDGFLLFRYSGDVVFYMGLLVAVAF